MRASRSKKASHAVADGGTRRLRCAVYTRKSSEEGLEQSFNSLHAQREACEAYILSQVGEGWTLLPTAYDDGGFSGGNMERPGLARLLADLDAGKLDVIVVYKVDRLTRSLMDFARIVERLDARGVSFVSVTQAFNTTSSMGRLTLNVLLSFAQFEREVTGERIRDKIAASKARGIWMGGNLPLGYDLGERRLVVNPVEAETVRHMFDRYLELGSVPALARELHEQGVTSKRWTAESGRAIGGVRLRPGGLYYILQNQLYLGKVVHHDIVHDGEHEPIVDRALFDAVQARLAGNRRRHRDRPTRAASSPLTGIIHDAEDVPMRPTFGYGRGAVIYRYYVSATALPGPDQRPARSDIIRRVPAAKIEAAILERLTQLSGRRDQIGWSDAAPLLRKVEIRERSIHLLLDPAPLLDPHETPARASARLEERIPTGDSLAVDADGTIRLIVEQRAVFHSGRSWKGGYDAAGDRKQDPELISMLKAAHALLDRHGASPLDPQSHRHAQTPAYQRDRRLMAIGLLAPDIQRAILESRAPAQLTTAKLLGQDIPIGWHEQRKALGFKT